MKQYGYSGPLRSLYSYSYKVVPYYNPYTKGCNQKKASSPTARGKNPSQGGSRDPTCLLSTRDTTFSRSNLQELDQGEEALPTLTLKGTPLLGN